jgi:hypothetical protein
MLYTANIDEIAKPVKSVQKKERKTKRKEPTPKEEHKEEPKDEPKVEPKVESKEEPKEEKVVEKIVKVPVEKIVEKIVEVPVEKIVERIVEVPKKRVRKPKETSVKKQKVESIRKKVNPPSWFVEYTESIKPVQTNPADEFEKRMKKMYEMMFSK